MFREAVELESSWGKYITQGQILGLTDSIIEQYIQYLADKRLEAIGFDRLYGVEHPIRWVENFSSFMTRRQILKGMYQNLLLKGGKVLKFLGLDF